MIPRDDKEDIFTLVIGDIMLDKYVHGVVERVSPESCCPILKEKSCEYQLGGAANVAKHLKRMGENVMLVGVIGHDDNGRRIRNLLEYEHIDISFMFTYDTTTTCKTRYINDLYRQMFRKDSELFVTLNNEDVNKIWDIFSQKKIDTIVISDYNKGIVSKTLCQNLIDLANNRGINVIIDIKEPDIPKYKGATIVKGNEREIRHLTERFPCNGNEGDCLKQLRQTINSKYLVMTCGEEGIKAVDNNSNIISIPSQKQMVFDVTGAGDVVTSYISYFFRRNFPFNQILYFANKAASIKVERFGNSFVGVDEVLNKQGKEINKSDFLKISFDKKVVFTNGCFDILHAGHIDLLQKAKELGDILVVGLNSDESIKRIKGDKRPINKLDYRIKMLSSIQCVDYIIVFDEETPLDLIEAIKPDVLVKGGDYQIDDIVGAEIVRSNGGQVLTIPFVYNISTTDIINKIIK